MRIILTEKQVRLIERITINEDMDFVGKIKDDINNIKKECDKLYNLISFSTIAEIRDGETDISVLSTKVKRIEDVIYSIDTKISTYFDRFDDETKMNKGLDDIQADLDSRIRTVTNKASALTAMILQLEPFSAEDWASPFKNITPKEI